VIDEQNTTGVSSNTPGMPQSEEMRNKPRPEPVEDEGTMYRPIAPQFEGFHPHAETDNDATIAIDVPPPTMVREQSAEGMQCSLGPRTANNEHNATKGPIAHTAKPQLEVMPRAPGPVSVNDLQLAKSLVAAAAKGGFLAEAAFRNHKDWSKQRSDGIPMPEPSEDWSKRRSDLEPDESFPEDLSRTSNAIQVHVPEEKARCHIDVTPALKDDACISKFEAVKKRQRQKTDRLAPILKGQTYTQKVQDDAPE
jgi:hypothetical protein